MKKLKEFLVKAKQDTYANEKAKNVKVKRGGRLLKFGGEKFHYQDKYFGTNPFSGEEIVLKNGKVIWVMNYYGKTLGKVNIKKIYGFLKKALIRVDVQQPFRGPSKFKEGNLNYTNEVKGNLKEFSGEEAISKNKKEVYKCHYHGGLVE